MDRYLITSEHTAEDCRHTVKQFREFHASFFTHFEWGCCDNNHHAYAFVEADSHEKALLSVPPLFRNKARAIKLPCFKPKASGDSIHDKVD